MSQQAMVMLAESGSTAGSAGEQGSPRGWAGQRRRAFFLGVWPWRTLDSQVDGPVDTITTLEPIAGKWAAFGWRVTELDGHDVDAVAGALGAAGAADSPSVLVCRTSTRHGLDWLPPDAHVSAARRWLDGPGRLRVRRGEFESVGTRPSEPCLRVDGRSDF